MDILSSFQASTSRLAMSFEKWLTKTSFIILVILAIAGCRYKERNFAASMPDSSLIEPPEINNLFLDSVTISSFLDAYPGYKEQADRIQKFYNKRNYQFAWFNNDGPIEQGGNFMNMLTNYVDEGIAESNEAYHRQLTQLYDSIAFKKYPFKGADDVTRETELLFTSEFFTYAEKIWGGIPEEQSKQAEWYIKRKRLPLVTLLDSMILKPDFFTEHEPVYRQYELLKNYLKKYRLLQKDHNWTPIVADQKSYRSGDSSQTIVELRKRLHTLGDLLAADTTSNKFDNTFEDAVKNFQRRYGLKEDGIVGAKMIEELNTPLTGRIEQIIINMERSRWVPARLQGDYLAVNIPEYQLHVYETDSLVWSCNVVVGSITNETVIFNDKMKYVVFSPYWNVTPTIVANEVLPAVKKNSGYLSKHNMEVVAGGKVVDPASIDWSKYSGKNFPYMVRQKPGPNNSLGAVKFLFPNNYNIYLHDTPSKNLFNEPSRAFSHGCIRVGEPGRLAKYLLRNDSTWTEDKIDKAMKSGKETFVTLKEPVPVFIAYFTAWVDRNGKLNFRDDIYGHDARLAKVLFAKPTEM